MPPIPRASVQLRLPHKACLHRAVRLLRRKVHRLLHKALPLHQLQSKVIQLPI